jgi:hypothetical protein
MGSVLTQTPVDVPSAERCEPGSFPLRTACFPTVKQSDSVDADAVAAQWVDSFNKALSNPETAGIPRLFLAESYWRDQLCMSWDFHTLQGPEKIADLLKQSKNISRIKSFDLDKSSALRSPAASVIDANGVVKAVSASLKIETDVGRGEGLVRLVQDERGWKAFTLFTSLKELKGHEELVGKRRPTGVQHGEHISRKNWLDRRNAEENFEGDEEPVVLILGMLYYFLA